MTDKVSRSSVPAWLVIVGVGYQWFYNGANFLAFKVGGDAFHPLMLAALRFGAAALLLLPFAAVRWRRNAPTLREIGASSLLGIVMLVGGQTLAIWGTHFLPPGVASVFGSAAPLFLALFAWLVFRQPLSRREMGGVALGFAGLMLMGWMSSHSGGFSVAGAALMLSASALWAAGSLGSTRIKLPDDPVLDLAMQLLSAAAVLGIAVTVSPIAGETHFAQVAPKVWGALAFLVIASTVIGYAVFLAINRRVSPTLANTYNYVAPVIALGLSALLHGEPLSWGKMAAAGVVLAGVALMIKRREPKNNQAPGAKA